MHGVRAVEDLAYYDGPADIDGDGTPDEGPGGPAFDDKKHRLDLYLPTERGAGGADESRGDGGARPLRDRPRDRRRGDSDAETGSGDPPDDDGESDEDAGRDDAGPDGDTAIPAASPPLLMFIHGGGWVGGDRKHYVDLGKRLAERGIATALISYRLTPDVLFPEHVEDAARACAWLHARADEYGYDAGAMFIAGHSAGGHSTALLALDKRYLAAHDLDADEVIAGAIPMSGVYTIALNLFDAFGDDRDVWKDATASTHVRETAFPIMLVHGDRDGPGLGLDAWGLERALEKLDSDVTRHEIANRNHFSIIMKMAKRDDIVLNTIVDFISNHAGG